MTKTIVCNDIFPGCDGVVRGETDDEALAGAVAHARDAHGVVTIDPDTEHAVRAAIRDE